MASKANPLKSAKTLLKIAANRLCAEEPEQGDYCGGCGVYAGAGESHKRGCLYVRITRFLKRNK